MRSRLVAFFLFLVCPQFAAAKPELADLVQQLEGKQCRYEFEGVGTNVCREKPAGASSASEVASGLLSRVVTAAGLATPEDCKCRGAAARCLGQLGADARDAVGPLVRYLHDGPADFDTGDGIGAWCLSAALSALGDIGDEAAVPALIDYLRSPRPYNTEPFAGPGKSCGIPEAANALAKFGKKAEAGVPEISKYHLVGPLGHIPSPQSVQALKLFLSAFLERVRSKPGEKQEDDETKYWNHFPQWIVAALAGVRALDQQDAAGIDISPALPELREILNEYSPSHPEGCPLCQFAVGKDGWQLRDLAAVSAKLLIRKGEVPAAPEVVTAILYQHCGHDPGAVPALLTLGPKLDSYLPDIIREAGDLQFRPGDARHRIDGCRSAASLQAIELLVKHHSPAALKGLEELRKEDPLRRRIERNLKKFAA